MDDNDLTRTAGDENVNPAEAVSAAKGKGKAAESLTQNMSMDEDDDSSDEETGAEEDVWFPKGHCYCLDSPTDNLCRRPKEVCSWSCIPNI